MEVGVTLARRSRIAHFYSLARRRGQQSRIRVVVSLDTILPSLF